MAEDDVQELNAEERLLQTHKKERKELQGKIQSLRHSIPKGDKKKKREITVEIAKLEAELTAKQEKDLQDLQISDEGIAEQLQNTSINALKQHTQENTQKMSKAQKRRDKKANKEKERNKLIQQQEMENESGARSMENKKLKSILDKRNLAIYEIPSDGNCLYKAVEHQLELQNIEKSVETLRREVSQYMIRHPEEFLPFLISPTTGDSMTEDEFHKFCKEVATTSSWGGQVELQAISNVCQVPIEVIQADGATILTGEKYKNGLVTLSYHRHAYGLGEHYNSVIPNSMIEDKTDEFL